MALNFASVCSGNTLLSYIAVDPVLTGSEIRLFLVIGAFLQFSGMAFAFCADLTLNPRQTTSRFHYCSGFLPRSVHWRRDNDRFMAQRLEPASRPQNYAVPQPRQHPVTWALRVVLIGLISSFRCCSLGMAADPPAADAAGAPAFSLRGVADLRYEFSCSSGGRARFGAKLRSAGCGFCVIRQRSSLHASPEDGLDRAIPRCADRDGSLPA